MSPAMRHIGISVKINVSTWGRRVPSYRTFDDENLDIVMGVQGIRSQGKRGKSVRKVPRRWQREADGMLLCRLRMGMSLPPMAMWW